MAARLIGRGSWVAPTFGRGGASLERASEPQTPGLLLGAGRCSRADVRVHQVVQLDLHTGLHRLSNLLPSGLDLRFAGLAVPGGQGTTYRRARLGSEHVGDLRTATAPVDVVHVRGGRERDDRTRPRARGTVEAEPSDVAGARRTQITDPADAVVAIWEPGDHIGDGRVNEGW